MELTREFVYLQQFGKRLKILKLIEQDEISIEKILLANPKIGDVVRGTNGLRKLRYSSVNSGSGKSGSFRIFYVDIESSNLIILITLISKGESDNLSSDERNNLQQKIKKLKRFYD